MKRSKFRYLYIVLAMSLVLSAVLAAVGLTNSQIAEAAAAATATPPAALTATTTLTEDPAAMPDKTQIPAPAKTVIFVNNLESEPVDAETSAATETPAVNQTSAVTEAPALSRDTCYDQNTRKTEAPAVSETPVATQTPEATETPAVSESPAAAETPEATETPAVSESPAAAETPVPETTADAAGIHPAPIGGDTADRGDKPYAYEKLDEAAINGTYTVDNALFGIDSKGGNARATTDGINAALVWAKDQGYTTIKFETGKYMVQCNWRDRCIAPTDGILVPSGLTLDLGDSTFMMEPNSFPEYCIFGIVSQNNVTIKNGTLIGDLDDHVFAPSTKSPTHEYGFGICISASKNVLIQNVTMSKMTGDGVIVEGSYSTLADGGSVSSKVRILNCDISDCRRQGISVIGMRNSEIAGNRIYNISGTSPEYGIDIESELDYIIDDLKIHDNVIYGCAGGAISCNKGTNYEVYDNVCSGNILTVYSTYVKIYGNTIKNSFIEVMRGSSNITVEDNILEGDSRVQID